MFYGQNDCHFKKSQSRGGVNPRDSVICSILRTNYCLLKTNVESCAPRGDSL
jgi:hypothetical protein